MAVLHLYFWNNAKPPTIAEIKDFEPKANDHIILARKITGNKTTYQFAYYKAKTDDVPYAGKKSLKAVTDKSDILSLEILSEIDKEIDSSSKVQAYSNDDNADETDTLEYLKEIVNLYKDSTLPNFTARISEIEESLKEEQTSEEKEDDDEEEKDEDTDQAIVDSVTKAPDLTLLDRDVSASEVVELIKDIDPHMKYLGFNPAKVRHFFLNRNENMDSISRDLQICFMAYAHIGNNISKLNVKRVDLKTTKKVLAVVNGMSVAKKVGDTQSLTLPRIAISFMPEYLIFRRFLTVGLQNQTTSTIDVVYKDIVFYGADMIRNLNGYTQFHQEFSALIANGGSGADYKDDKEKKQYDRWCSISKDGYNNDNGIHANMQVAFGAKPMSREQASDLITSNITGYKAVLNANPP